MFWNKRLKTGEYLPMCVKATVWCLEPPQPGWELVLFFHLSPFLARPKEHIQPLLCSLFCDWLWKEQTKNKCREKLNLWTEMRPAIWYGQRTDKTQWRSLGEGEWAFGAEIKMLFGKRTSHVRAGSSPCLASPSCSWAPWDVADDDSRGCVNAHVVDQDSVPVSKFSVAW